MILRMAEKIEHRWDGITTVAATLGVTIIGALGIVTGEVTTEAIYLIIAGLSGIGGYSMHNVVRSSNT